GAGRRPCPRPRPSGRTAYGRTGPWRAPLGLGLAGGVGAEDGLGFGPVGFVEPAEVLLGGLAGGVRVHGPGLGHRGALPHLGGGDLPDAPASPPARVRGSVRRSRRWSGRRWCAPRAGVDPAPSRRGRGWVVRRWS